MITGYKFTDGTDIEVGDIVKFRCKGFSLSGKGIVCIDEKEDGHWRFYIKDTRKEGECSRHNLGRLYPFYEDADYTLVERLEPTLEDCNRLWEKFERYKETAEQYEFLNLLVMDSKLKPAHEDLNKRWDPEHGKVFARTMKYVVFPRLGIEED